jgi:hypothetical protein
VSGDDETLAADVQELAPPVAHQRHNLPVAADERQFFLGLAATSLALLLAILQVSGRDGWLLTAIGALAICLPMSTMMFVRLVLVAVAPTPEPRGARLVIQTMGTVVALTVALACVFGHFGWFAFGIFLGFSVVAALVAVPRQPLGPRRAESIQTPDHVSG